MNIREKLLGLEEDVSGTIIGDVTFPYQFWTINEPYGNSCIAKNFFKSDEDAISWFKNNFPDWYKKGVEMRIYD